MRTNKMYTFPMNRIDWFTLIIYFGCTIVLRVVPRERFAETREKIKTVLSVDVGARFVVTNNIALFLTLRRGNSLLHVFFFFIFVRHSCIS